MVKDSFAEVDDPNQNPGETMGVKIIKQGAEAVMNYFAAPNNMWPYAHLYVANVNNVCTSPFLKWKTPISRRHGYAPDISVYLLYMFWDPIYFKEDENYPKPRERNRNWIGFSNNVKDRLTYFIYCHDKGTIVSRSDIRKADNHRGGIINRRVDPDKESEDEITSDSGEIFSIDKIKPMRSPRLHDSEFRGE